MLSKRLKHRRNRDAAKHRHRGRAEQSGTARIRGRHAERFVDQRERFAGTDRSGETGIFGRRFVKTALGGKRRDLVIDRIPLGHHLAPPTEERGGVSIDRSIVTGKCGIVFINLCIRGIGRRAASTS